MLKTTRNNLLATLILVFSFGYRAFLMLSETFPPGADIGLHNSVINSITQSGNTNFLWNYYHMGGGSSVTFPGYHIFTSYIILLTGMPNYLAHALVVSLFSSLIVAVAFLLTSKIWNPSAALIVAFLVAISRFDLEILMWGGYSNVATLMLIPLAFYMFLKKDRFSMLPFLAVTSLICSSIFLTHSLSAILFIAITVVTVLVGVVFPRPLEEPRSSYILWILPIILGAIAIAPFLIQVVPSYLDPEAVAFTGGLADIKYALLPTKLLPFDIVWPLFIFVFLYLVFSKYYIGKFFSLPTVLLVLWWLIPTFLTQGYLVGLYTDYNRFLYFLILPVILLIGLGFHALSRLANKTLEKTLSTIKDHPQVKIGNNKTLRKMIFNLEHKNISTPLILFLLLYTFISVPLFITPSQAIGVQSFYQLIDDPKYEAIKWAQQNTPANAVFLTDAQYGWWFSGFSKRATISAVEPQYLTNEREVQPAKIASFLLDTDYVIDNSLIQVREDGAYIGRHNPIFLAKLNNSYFPYSICHFSNEEITITLRNNQKVEIVNLIEVPVKETYIENGTDYASIYVARGNQLFNFTQKITVYEGVRFANVTQKIQTTNPFVTFDTINSVLHTKGLFMQSEIINVVALVDINMKVIGQLIFDQKQPITTPLTTDNLAGLGILYNLNATKSAELNFYVGAYEYEKDLDTNLPEKERNDVYHRLIINNTQTYLEKIDHSPSLEIFNYQQALVDHDVSFIALRDKESLTRFINNPFFNLVFANEEVAIFKVQK